MKLKLQQPGTHIKAAFASGLTNAPYLTDSFSARNAQYIPVYSLSLKHLVGGQAGQDLQKVAVPVGWQCIAPVADGTQRSKAVVGEVSSTLTAPRQAGNVFRGPVRMTRLSYGDVVDEVYKNALELKAKVNDPNLPGGNYEPRMLRIPGLRITAFWLKSDQNSAADLIVPLHFVMTSLSRKAYTPGDFLAIVQPAAHAWLQAPVQEDAPTTKAAAAQAAAP